MECKLRVRRTAPGFERHNRQNVSRIHCVFGPQRQWRQVTPPCMSFSNCAAWRSTIIFTLCNSGSSMVASDGLVYSMVSALSPVTLYDCHPTHLIPPLSFRSLSFSSSITLTTTSLIGWFTIQSTPAPTPVLSCRSRSGHATGCWASLKLQAVREKENNSASELATAWSCEAVIKAQ